MATEIGVVNGATGVLTKIVYETGTYRHCQESTADILLKPPLYVLVLLDRPRHQPFAGLAPGVVAIEPRVSDLMVTKFIADGTKKITNLKRRQLPLTPAFALTDYKCQGTTLPNAIIDLEEVNTSTMRMSCFHVLCRWMD